MTIEQRLEELLAKMSLREKIGQMVQIGGGPGDWEQKTEWVKKGLVGSLFNVEPEKAAELQRISVQETRLGIPLIVGRDVIHGYRTIFPIPLGQAASWNPTLIKEAARSAAYEASAAGAHWTFSPMVDISRDPRWGRIAEGAGEDPFLASAVGVAMVEGYQGDDLSKPGSLAACAKHFVAYGATEGGRDYNTTDVSERTLREVYLRPFKACVDAGVATLMTGFNDIAGVPASGNAFTLRQILRDEWKFDGFVVSDWASIREMTIHGFCADERHSAREAALAGVDMEMESTCYLDHLESLVSSGEVPMGCVDDAVRAILRIKFRLGLFERPLNDLSQNDPEVSSKRREIARQLARESCVLLKNEGDLLPLRKDLGSIAVIGLLADSPMDQIGCWAFDGNRTDVQTPISAIRSAVSPSMRIQFVPGPSSADGEGTNAFDEAVRAAQDSELTILFLGEGEAQSGEARCRASLDLPGPQNALAQAVHATGKPVVVVLMSGRLLTVPWLVEHIPAILLAWHPGTMGGPAIADLLFGDHAPSGKLPVTIPRSVGQIPLYYNHKNTGRPPTETARKMPMGTPLNPEGFYSGYLDIEPSPAFPFGFGLSYTRVEYGPAEVVEKDSGFEVAAVLTNIGGRPVCEVAQLYIRDIVGNVTRPVKELKGFQRVDLDPGESKRVVFELTAEDLRFYDRDCNFRAEPGDFHVWIAGNSETGCPAKFTLKSTTG